MIFPEIIPVRKYLTLAYKTVQRITCMYWDCLTELLCLLDISWDTDSSRNNPSQQMFNSGLWNRSGYHLFRPQIGLQNYLLSMSLDVIFPEIIPVNLIGQSHILLVWPKDPITVLFSLLSITQFFIFPEGITVKKYSTSVHYIIWCRSFQKSSQLLSS